MAAASHSMRILLLKPKHIGDSLLLTPTIVAIRRDYPAAEIWVIVRRGCEGILAGCPEIDKLLTVSAVEKRERRGGDFWRDVRTLGRLLATTFDAVFELGDGHRSRLFARLVRSRRRYSVKPATAFFPAVARRFDGVSTFDWTTCHRVEKDFHSVAEFLPLGQPIPALRFAQEATREWAPAAGLDDFCVMQIGKRQSVSRWHRAGWEEVGRALLERYTHLIVTSGGDTHEIEEANGLREQLGPRVLCTLGQADWSQTAGLLYRARLYVGLDTATMHLAAACLCPIVALFGPTFEGHWHPWQMAYHIVSGSPEPPTDDPRENLRRAKLRTMAAIEPRDVIAACYAFID